MKRCFISVEFPEEVKKEIKKIQDRLPEFMGKKTELENIHLTLKFLGEIGDEKIEEVKKKLGEIKCEKLNCEINEIGVFSSNYVRIVWLHLNGCEELQKQIDEKLSGIFKKEKRFMGHITIARVKSLKDRKKFVGGLGEIKFGKIGFWAGKFFLKESVLGPEGPDYRVLSEFNLK